VNRALAFVLAVLLATTIVGCSPEATRVRNGGPGADIGNHSPSAPSPSTPPALPGATATPA
jgi:hypothetical protein